MKAQTTQSARLGFVRPLVRYVDAGQAVLEAWIGIQRPLPTMPDQSPPAQVEALIEIDTAEGFHDEHSATLGTHAQSQTVRIELVHPQLWWPAGMGEQPLYDLSVKLVVDGQLVDTCQTVVGLTSVRGDGSITATQLLVNGQVRNIRDVVHIDLRDEQAVLPVGGHSLLVVRGHYGPNELYDAADRAGILLIQCLPIHPEGHPENELLANLDRLAGHPSLAGWYVGHFGGMTERMTYCLKSLDPTRNVFRRVPGGD